MKIIHDKKGMTLIEVMIAIALLAILVSAFVMIFSTSLVNILNFGNKSKAVAYGNQAMEAIYSIQEADQGLIEAELNNMGGYKALTVDAVHTYASGDFNYFVQTVSNGTNEGYKVTIVYFYRGGDKYIDLETFVKGSD